jgi:putative ABC transport system permease protein
VSLRGRMQDDIERDIRDHIDIETRENIERGMSPEEARSAALRKFGNPALIAEDTRSVWRWSWADRLLQDARYALRGLRRNPLFAAVAILTLALGIGMNTAVFSVVSAVLIKPLPYSDSGRLVWLGNYNRRFHFEASSVPDFADWREQAKSYEAMAGYGSVDSTVQDGSDSAKRSFVFTTPEFWRIAGVHAALGRLFNETDRNVVVLTWHMFQQQFRGDPSALGRAVLIDGRHTTIIGVLPKAFSFLPPSNPYTRQAFGPAGISGEVDAFTPEIITPQLRSRGASFQILFVVARLKPGVTVEQARAELKGIQTRIARENPALRGFYAAAELRVTPLQEKLVGESRRALLVLLAAVGFVLLIACANLGNLLLARASTRQREIAIRASIGAGRNRLLRQFLVEGLTLALLGGAAGLVVARAADALLVRLSPSAVPRLGEVVIDWRVSLFTLAVSIGAGIAFGLAPLFSLSADSLYSTLKEGGRGSSDGAAGLFARRILVASELALAMVLLTGAGLMVKSFARMYAHPASFQPEKIARTRVFLSGPGYRIANSDAAAAYAQRVIADAGRVPGVQAVALTEMSGSGGVDIDGPPRFPPGQAPQVFYRAISSGYPGVVGLPLLKGRWTADDEPSPAVLVNETFARLIFENEDPLGQRLRIWSKVMTIVGVVADLKVSRLDAEPDPEILVPYRQTPDFRRFDVLAKTTGNTAAIIGELRKVVQRVDPTQPPYGVMTLEDALAESVAPQRFNLLLLATFAGSAVLLAVIGIYGVMSYSVTRRTHEIGVRIALGARHGEIVQMVVRQGLAVALAGIGVGIAAALSLTRLIATLLFEVKPNDPLTFVLVAMGLAATALLASWLPARKAAAVDPLMALRYE